MDNFVPRQDRLFCSSAQFGNSFIFDLAHAFTGKIEPVANIFQAQRVIYTYAKEITNHFFLPIGKVLNERSISMFKRTLCSICRSCVPHLDFPVHLIRVLSSPSDKWCIHTHVAGVDAKGRDNFFSFHFQNSASSSAEGSRSNSCSS